MYAIAHVRGGGDLGAYWHADGMLMNKRNTFTDFVTCAEHLIQARVLRRRLNLVGPRPAMHLSRLCGYLALLDLCVSLVVVRQGSAEGVGWTVPSRVALAWTTQEASDAANAPANASAHERHSL